MRMKKGENEKEREEVKKITTLSLSLFSIIHAST